MVSTPSLTVYLLFQSYICNCLNIPAKEEKHELDEYAKEFKQVLLNSSGLQSSSSENHSGRNYEDLFLSDGVLHSGDQGLSSDIVSEGLNSISSGEVPEISDQFGSSEKVHDFRPFIIDDGIDLSPKGNQSRECILDRKEINLLFQKCIHHNQTTKSPMLGNKNVTFSEPNLRDYDAQFLKYCRRAPELRECVKNFIITTKAPCLDEGAHETIRDIEEITTHVIKFVCNKEADRISIFIEDGGLECLLSKHYRLYACLFFNFGNYALIYIAELTSLDLSALKCTNIRGAEQCIMQELELCEHQVSAIASGILFNIIKEIASCEDSTEDLTELTEDQTELIVSESSDEAQTTESSRSIRSHVSDQLEHIGRNSFAVSSDSNSPSKLSTFSPIVDTDLINDGQNTQVEDEMTTSSPKVDSAMVRGAPIYPDKYLISTTTKKVESLGIDGQIRKDEDTMPTSSPNVEDLIIIDGQKQHDANKMSTSSPIVAGLVIEGQKLQDEEEMSTIRPSTEFEVSQNSIFNNVLEAHISATATAGILCALVLFYSVIILSYKCMVNNDFK